MQPIIWAYQQTYKGDAKQEGQKEIKAEELSNQSEKELQDDISDEIEEQSTYQIVTGKYNTYNRQKLYEEVWAKPVVQVAIQYGVSDVAIHKICKSLQIPVLPRG